MQMIASEYSQFQARLNQILLDILEHGFGEARIRICLQKEHKRQIVIEAGKSYQFMITLSDIHS